jgi:hypothetical protein
MSVNVILVLPNNNISKIINQKISNEICIRRQLRIKKKFILRK